MSEVKLLIIGRLVISAICFAGAAYVAQKGVDGWGWLILAGVLLGGMTINNDD